MSEIMVDVPRDSDEIMDAGGVDRLANQAALEARQEVWRECLDVFEADLEWTLANPDAYKSKNGHRHAVAHLTGWIARLRRRLGIKTTNQLEMKRAQTRERVRRFRERQRLAKP